MIPTEMELSQMFGISRTTVRQAISDLVREEHLYRIKSKGTFVAHPKLVQGFIQSIQSFDDDVRSTGRTPAPRYWISSWWSWSPRWRSLWSCPRAPRPSISTASGLPTTSPSSGWRPTCPMKRAALSWDTTLTGSPSIRCCQAGRHPGHHVTRICEARAADPEDAAVLGLKRGRPVHYFQTIGYNQSGKLIELSFAHYRGDQSRFRVELFRE